METYRIRVSAETIELESSDKEWIESKEKEYSKYFEKVLGGSGAKKPYTKAAAAYREPKLPDRHVVGKISPNEYYRNYIQSNNIKARADIATFFVYYLEKVLDQKEISSGDVKNLFKEAQYPGWNNINIADALNKAKRKAFLNCVGGFWSLTITGEDFVINAISE